MRLLSLVIRTFSSVTSPHLSAAAVPDWRTRPSEPEVRVHVNVWPGAALRFRQRRGVRSVVQASWGQSALRWTVISHRSGSSTIVSGSQSW